MFFSKKKREEEERRAAQEAQAGAASAGRDRVAVVRLLARFFPTQSKIHDDCVGKVRTQRFNAVVIFTI